MPDYTLGKIYKLHCLLENDDEPLVYYGSTTEKYLSSRLAGHIRNYKKYLNGKTNYYTSFKLFEKYKSENVLITLVELYSCNSKAELEAKERYYIESFDCCNKNIPTRTIKEYWNEYKQLNIDQIKEYKKEYYESNNEKIKKKHKEYRQLNIEKLKETYICECGGQYTYTGKLRHNKTTKHINYMNTII
jgi:hypothetical protein